MPRRPVVDSAGLECFHPLVADWFRATLGAPTSIQRQAWPVIAAGEHTLLLAPTGSGKTLAAFLVALERLAFREEPAADAPRGVRVLYISPLKALGADMARNLEVPLAGLTSLARASSTPFRAPRIGLRSGDTPAAERRQLIRQPPDILLTTPESLYLLLTSQARSILATVETVIIDEIHALVGNKRGSHLFVSLERLEDERRQRQPTARGFQRVGLSATQRPLEEVAQLLGGFEAPARSVDELQPRPVRIVVADVRKQLDLRLEMPGERPSTLGNTSPDDASAAVPSDNAFWPAVYPRLIELIRTHRSTMLFVNNRRLAERLAAALNEQSGEELARAHHGSLAKEARRRIEDQLKAGELRAIVATSSLELGIDMGAVDLVIQIASPPSIAAGLQRVGRAGHQVGAPSSGVLFPKFRGDLLASSAAAARMMAGEVEETFYPRLPLDVLAQQLVAMVAARPTTVDQLYATVRRAAPFHELPRTTFEGVLDLLSGRYPSDEFYELRPRITWDRTTGQLRSRQGAGRVALANAGTIPDRGLFGVFLAGTSAASARVGELDEEMVFETRIGDVFQLGASSWRVLEITADRVLVAPAPGEAGRMPFWRGEGPGRPLEFGRAIGQLTRQLLSESRSAALARLTTSHGLDANAAERLLEYVELQVAATREVPTDGTLVLEYFRDEAGDWRVVLLSPFGSRVHAPWAIVSLARLRAELPTECDAVWSDDGIAWRIPAADRPPPLDWLVPHADEVEASLVRELPGTSLFAARFRENAARALLLPRRYPGRRTPLWLQRRRAADLLRVAARYPAFPLLLETYRECLRDVFDLPGWLAILRSLEQGTMRVATVETQSPSPFANSLLFGFSGNFIYEHDTPLAERRAQALALDHVQLGQLLGKVDYREWLDAASLATVSDELQHLSGRQPPRNADDVHDLLRLLGDLDRSELARRCAGAEATADAPSSALESWLRELRTERRIIAVTLAGREVYIAVEDAARYRDALGVTLPDDLPPAFLAGPVDPLQELVRRYARTHGPFSVASVAARWGLGTAPVQAALAALEMAGRVVTGEFTPGGTGREWCDVDVLRRLRRRSLAVARASVEPVDAATYARFLIRWQGIDHPRRGLDGLLDAIEQLQGLPLAAATLEREILPARVADYSPDDLDELCAAGEVTWRGCGRLGSSDGRVTLYLSDQAPRLAPPVEPLEGDEYERIREQLRQRGALFFDDLARTLGGFRPDLLERLWDLVWQGEITNDTLFPLRALRGSGPARKPRRAAARFRSRRSVRAPGTAGRWSLWEHSATDHSSPTERQTDLVRQLIRRYGVVTPEIVAAESWPGGFAAVYPLLKACEEAGRLRRGYFLAGRGPSQFASPEAAEGLRSLPPRSWDDEPPRVLAATDPANPYGAALDWPGRDLGEARPQRADGSRVILDQGRLLAFLGRTGRQLLSFLDPHEPQHARDAERLSLTLARLATEIQPVLLERIDGAPAASSSLAPVLLQHGFVVTSHGLLHRRREPPPAHKPS
ncbi:MAG: crosslink repair DNA glycosylase YcaQ family protein [Pirellulales bacterium]